LSASHAVLPAPWSQQRPLLKWAGGKRQLLPVFRRFYPDSFSSYFEPFLGSAAVFFDLWMAGRVRSANAHLTDSNADLIACYAAVRDCTESVIEALEQLDRGHRRDGARHYYRIRDRFNRQRRERKAHEDEGPVLAAMLIYLNRTGYNGLFRLNASGEFNVPAGRYARPVVCDVNLVRSVAAALQGVSLACCPYDAAIERAGRTDLLYFDPPYAPLSATSSFGAYTAARFTTRDQERLCEAVVALARNGSAVMLSNSSADSVQQLYKRAVSDSSAGLGLWQVLARRAINSRPTSRGRVAELLLTNLEPRQEPATGELVRIA
jgi:DNA adenine methylase